MQLGFHGVVGLGIARALARKVPEHCAEGLVSGAVLGSLLPDLDIYPTAVVTLCCGKAAAAGIHRSATHSILLLGILVIASFVPTRREGLPWFLRGMAAGVTVHMLADYFMWFAPLDIFWPFSHMRGLANVLAPLHEGAGPPSVRLLGNLDFIANMREAVEFAAFACFFLALARIARHDPSSRTTGSRIVKWERVAWWCFAVAVAAGVLLPYEPVLKTLVVAPWLLLFTPLCWIYTVRLRGAIRSWAIGEHP